MAEGALAWSKTVDREQREAEREVAVDPDNDDVRARGTARRARNQNPREWARATLRAAGSSEEVKVVRQRFDSNEITPLEALSDLICRQATKLDELREELRRYEERSHSRFSDPSFSVPSSEGDQLEDVPPFSDSARSNLGLASVINALTDKAQERQSLTFPLDLRYCRASGLEPPQEDCNCVACVAEKNRRRELDYEPDAEARRCLNHSLHAPAPVTNCACECCELERHDRPPPPSFTTCSSPWCCGGHMCSRLSDESDDYEPDNYDS